MIVTIDIFLKPDDAVRLVALFACNGQLPRTKHEFDTALKTAARETFQDGYEMYNADDDVRKRVELLTRSARPAGWLQ